MLIKLPFDLPNIGALTVYPWVFMSKSTWSAAPSIVESVMRHEQVHIEQQRSWFRLASVFGLLAWYFVYELCLPFAWNPMRRKWETAAYAAQGFTPSEITEKLKHAPYWLWA
jgi:hypothetical protein